MEILAPMARLYRLLRPMLWEGNGHTCELATGEQCRLFVPPPGFTVPGEVYLFSSREDTSLFTPFLSAKLIEKHSNDKS